MYFFGQYNEEEGKSSEPVKVWYIKEFWLDNCIEMLTIQFVLDEMCFYWEITRKHIWYVGTFSSRRLMEGSNIGKATVCCRFTIKLIHSSPLGEPDLSTIISKKTVSSLLFRLIHWNLRVWVDRSTQCHLARRTNNGTSYDSKISLLRTDWLPSSNLTEVQHLGRLHTHSLRRDWRNVFSNTG